jgi:uncharacterized BrkB/YihY/UPF0761 family membrane protein
MSYRLLFLCLIALYWFLPDYRHPLRYALREAGLEPTPKEYPS